MIDAELLFDGSYNPANSPPFSGSAITTSRRSTNALDLLVARDLGANAILGVHFAVTTAFVGGTSLQISFQVSADASTWFDVLDGPVMPTAQLILDCPAFRYPVPLNQVLNAAAGVLKLPGRYLSLNYTVVGTYTAGAVVAYINPIADRKQLTIYPNNYTVAIATGEVS